VEVIADLGFDKVGVSVNGDHHVGQSTAHGDFDGLGGRAGNSTRGKIRGGEKGIDERDDGGIGKGHKTFENVVEELKDTTLRRRITLFHGEPAKVKNCVSPEQGTPIYRGGRA
jgi:hypothetical protein